MFQCAISSRSTIHSRFLNFFADVIQTLGRIFSRGARFRNSSSFGETKTWHFDFANQARQIDEFPDVFQAVAGL